MRLLLLAAAAFGAEIDAAALAAQAAAAAQAQAGAQAQPPADQKAAAGAGSGFRELKAPVIRRTTPAPPDEKHEERPQTPARRSPRGGGVVGGVKLPTDSGRWEPVSVAIGGAPAASACSWRGAKKTTPAEVSAKLLPVGDDKRLILRIAPKGLASHFEVRLLVVEGVLDKAELVAVTPETGGYQTEAPSQAALSLGALDLRPGKGARNAGSIRGAEFAQRMPNGLPGLGTVRCDFNVKGLEGR